MLININVPRPGYMLIKNQYHDAFLMWLAIGTSVFVGVPALALLVSCVWGAILADHPRISAATFVVAVCVAVVLGVLALFVWGMMVFAREFGQTEHQRVEREYEEQISRNRYGQRQDPKERREWSLRVRLRRRLEAAGFQVL